MIPRNIIDSWVSNKHQTALLHISNHNTIDAIFQRIHKREVS